MFDKELRRNVQWYISTNKPVFLKAALSDFISPCPVMGVYRWLFLVYPHDFNTACSGSNSSLTHNVDYGPSSRIWNITITEKVGFTFKLTLFFICI